MEEHLAQAIQTDEVIANFFHIGDDPNAALRPPDEWFFGASSLGLGPNVPVPARPYIVWNEFTDVVHQAVRETSNARDRIFQIYVYDYKGDFTRINAIVKELRRLVKGMAPFTTEAGVRCSESLWGGMSGNITDDGYDSCARFGRATFTVSE